MAALATGPRPEGLAQEGLLTVRALLAVAAVAAEGLTPRSGAPLAGGPAWLEGGWRLDGGWPLFGALALVLQTAYPPLEGAPGTAGGRLVEAARRALEEDLAVPASASLAVLSARHTAPRGAGEALLQAVAHLALADWVRREGAWDSEASSEVQVSLRRAQALVREAFAVLCGPGAFGHTPAECEALAGLGVLARHLGGAELLALLDRLSCASEVTVLVRGGETWSGAENACMRTGADLSYRLALFPHHELVSDFVRSRGVPYCNESILRAVEDLARRLVATRGRARRRVVRIVEVGANLGDCVLFAVRRLQAVRGVEVQAVAVEASPAAVGHLKRSVRLNGLEGVVTVLNLAASDYAAEGEGSRSLRLLAKPRSSNSFTEPLADGAEQLEVGAVVEVAAAPLDEVVPFPRVDLLISHTNGQELSVLRGARRLLARSARRGLGVAVVLQLYGPDSGVVRRAGYDPGRALRWLAQRGLRARLGAFGLRRLGAQVLDVVAGPRQGFTWGRPRQRAAPDSRAEVDGRILRENLHLLRMRLPPLGAVLKAQAYGHGAALAGRVLAAARAEALFVSEAETALQLRASPELRWMPMLLLYQAPGPSLACALAAASVVVSALSMDWLREASEWPACSTRLRLHLMVDTGLLREGVRPSQAPMAAELILGRWPAWSLEGLYTHWCCPYDVAEMRRSRDTFEATVKAVQSARSRHAAAGGVPFTVHASSSSTALYKADYDLLRVGGLLFGDPIDLTDTDGARFRIPGPHRTLLWKSHLLDVFRAKSAQRFGRCDETDCSQRPGVSGGALLGLIPVGATEYSFATIFTGPHREKLPLLEKSTDSVVVEMPRSSRGFLDATIGMEVLLCEQTCVQGLFNLPAHIPRVLVHDPSMKHTHVPGMLALQDACISA